jgi:hypothetical protein
MSGEVTHLTLSLSFQERGPAQPARSMNTTTARGRVRARAHSHHPLRHLPIEIGEKSWNQFCACTKPFTL